MRFRTEGGVRRVDLGPLLDLVPAVIEEWAELRFDGEGRAVNPLAGEPVDALVLVSGRHRSVGAQYRVTDRTPQLELPDHRREEFEREAMELTRTRADTTAWGAHWDRRRAASETVGYEEHRYIATLREDGSRRLAFSVSDEGDTSAVHVALVHGPLPRLEVSGTVDLTALWRKEGTPGCIASILGGEAGGEATVDLRALDRSGRLLSVDGKANRFKGKVRIDVTTSQRRWTVAGRARLDARGIARPVLWFARSRIRRRVDEATTGLWESADDFMASVEAELPTLRSAVEQEGGPRQFVRRAIWDDTFELQSTTFTPTTSRPNRRPRPTG